MGCVRPVLLALAAGFALLATASCGGGSSPAPPSAPIVAAPDSSPTNGGENASANSCPLGAGDPGAGCSARSPELTAAVEAAIDRLVAERPELFDLQEEAAPNTGQYRVRDREAYLDGLVASLRAGGLCAERTLDRQRILAKSTNAFSEEWDVLTSRGFIWRGSYSYRQTCEPAVFPVAPADLVAYVRTAFFAFECADGVSAPPPPEGKMPLGCDGLVTATPKQRNGDDVPAWIHGTEVEWELREGAEVVRVEPDPRFSNPFNRILRPREVEGSFVLCATVLGKEGCLRGRTIP